jgi:Flp pilus assembly protein TadG
MNTKQAGATTIEFALVLILFLMFLLGIVDFSRMLFMWSAANEATRAGARYAVVCDNTGQQAVVLAKMQQVLPQISTVSVAWTPTSCDPTTCIGVTVSITNLNFRWISPIPGFASRLIPMPPFSTFLTREVMRQDPNSAAICS